MLRTKMTSDVNSTITCWYLDFLLYAALAAAVRDGKDTISCQKMFTKIFRHDNATDLTDVLTTSGSYGVVYQWNELPGWGGPKDDPLNLILVHFTNLAAKKRLSFFFNHWFKTLLMWNVNWSHYHTEI